MVNDFVEFSPKDEDGYSVYNGSKRRISESSDEEDTSSSLLPVPDTLKDDFKNALNNFCGIADYPVNFDRPTEREVSIARKITTANLLLDDLLNTKMAGDPIVFNVKSDVRGRGSDTSVTDSSSCGERCRSISVTPFAYPNVCDCPRKAMAPVVEEPEVMTQTRPRQTKRPRKRCFLAEKMMSMGLSCRRKKLVNEQTQVEAADVPFQCPCPKDVPISNEKSDESSTERECTCPPVRPIFKECHCDDKPEEKEASVQHNPPVVAKVSAEVQADVAMETDGEKKGVPEGLYTEMTTENQSASPLEFPNKADQQSPAPPVFKLGKTLNGRNRIDIYYFDHGNAAYYRTTDSHPAKYTEYIIERTDEYATKFWAEVFGTINIGVAFVISFVLQLYRCLFTAIIRALTVGLIQIFSDYFFKPLLTVVFNGLIQPCLILGYNVATSTKDFCVPVCEICEFCAKDIAIVFRSCRVVEINQRTCSSPSCQCNV